MKSESRTVWSVGNHEPDITEDNVLIEGDSCCQFVLMPHDVAVEIARLIIAGIPPGVHDNE